MKWGELRARQLSQLQAQRERARLRAPALRAAAEGLCTRLLQRLPFALTAAQARVVAEIADEVVVLELGAMIEKGDKMAVLTQPREPYTKMLLDAVPELAKHKRPPVSYGKPLLEAISLSKTYVMGSWPGKRRTVNAAPSRTRLASSRGTAWKKVPSSPAGARPMARWRLATYSAARS